MKAELVQCQFIKYEKYVKNKSIFHDKKIKPSCHLVRPYNKAEYRF